MSGNSPLVQRHESLGCACLCVCAHAGGGRGKETTEEPPASWLSGGMTVTGAAEWTLCTSSLSLRHMVTHADTHSAVGGCAPPQRCSAVQLWADWSDSSVF